MSEKSFAIVTVVSATAWGLLFYPPGVPKDRMDQPAQPAQPAQPKAIDASYSRQPDPGPRPIQLSAPPDSAVKAPAPIPHGIMTRHGETAMLGPVP